MYGNCQQVRDWLFVDDHCAAIDRILAADVAGETLHVGGEAEHENIEMEGLLCALIDERIGSVPTLAEHFPACPAASDTGSCRELITYARERVSHDRRYAVDLIEIRNRLEYALSETLQSGLSRTVNRYLANAPWWRAMMDRR